MNILTQNISKSLNPNLIAHRPKAQDIGFFEQELVSLWEKINRKGREEFVKIEMIDFLKKAIFIDKSYHINIKNDIDLVVCEDAAAPVKIMFEVKTESNKNEMITPTNFNRKAFQELVYYFMEERVGANNTDLTYLIITTVKDWYIFDAAVFEDIFNQSAFVKEYKKFKEGKALGTTTDFFYNDIAKPYIDSITKEIKVTYFSLADYVGEGAAQKSDIKNQADKSQDKIVNLFKILSPDFLLKRTITNDANELNQQFYEELLHIMGLEEVKDSGKNIIQRKAAQLRNPASLMEMILAELGTVGIEDIADKDIYGETLEEQSFAIALDLCTTWVNRILFLKLLEGQLMNYHDNNPKYRFLNTEMVANFGELYRLFHNVLAKKIEERGQYKEKYAFVPYLNSSLFDLTVLETKLVKVTTLDDSFMLPLHRSSVLRQTQTIAPRSEIRTLHYLLEFLDAYDFASDGSGSLTQEDNKPLINASVLGKVFEKINGYKDGSIYTPSFITMYMAAESVRRAILHKFEEANWLKTEKGASLKVAYTDLSNCLHGISSAKRKEANDLINSLKICDPAVGSGHLLVSVLNEIIAIKSELRLLVDEEGKELRYNVRAVNDELLVYNDDNDTEYFVYKPKSSSSLKVQKTLFEEKRKLIEACLFGVDLNPNSVKICRLRLWIELLKNAYYQRSGGDLGELETLPNIDINIKIGNSLLYQFDLDGKFETLTSAIKQKLRAATQKAKDQIAIYHSETDKTKKDTILKSIDALGEIMATIHNPRDEEYKSWKDAEAKLNQESNSLFGLGEISKEKGEELEKLADNLIALEKKYKEKQKSFFKSAFEWTYKFPTILDNEGAFYGFDIIIANPPYIQMSKMRAFSQNIKQQKRYETYTATGDVYCLFYELAVRLLRPKGILAYITSNKWMRAAYGDSLRNFFVQKANPLLLIDFGGTKVFDNATVDVNILLATKEPYEGRTLSSLFAGTKKELKESLFFSANASHSTFLPDTSWVILSPIEQSIKQKIEAIGTPLKDWDIQINYGIKTGYNEAFIIDEATKDKLIAEDAKSAEILRPILRGRDIKKYTAEFAGLYLIGIQMGWTNKHRKNEDAEMFFKNTYPAIYKHFKTIGDKEQSKSKGLYLRDDKGDYWWELRSCVYWNDFDKPKIVYIEIMTDNISAGYDFPCFASADAGVLLYRNTAYMMVGNIEKLNFILAILNSLLGRFLTKTYTLQLGNRQFRMLHQYVQHFPLPLFEKDNHLHKDCLNLVSLITTEKDKDLRQSLLSKLNSIIYNIFNFDKIEIELLNNVNN